MLRHALLDDCSVAHGFGERGDHPPVGLLRPRQVHGARVVTGSACRTATPPEADAVVSDATTGPIAVVTADCVPILMATRSGGAVAAVHAGWRGLAAGVVEAGVDALRRVRDEPIVAVVGPHIGPCCYEVDTPVFEALGIRHGERLHDAVRPTRPGHADLDLGLLALSALAAAGIGLERLGRVEPCCTRCHASRFHSYRRDGPRAGRLVHRIAANPAAPQA